ncbi:NAD(P)-binding protein [Sarocladium strictum]
MKGIQVKEYVKGPAELQVSEIPDPVPKPNEYLIQVHAAAANFFDILQVQGKYQNQPPFPWVAGAEFAGTVLATPSNPSSSAHLKFPVGARVFGGTQGAFATKVCVPESTLLPVPDGWSFEDAAGLFVTAPTSYAALVVRANIKKGDWVLVHAAAGGVGLAAVQIAKAYGATVVATASTQKKLDIAKSFGADHLVNSSDKSWPATVKALTPSSRGVDIVYDPVGLVDLSTKCTAWNGRILIVGFAAGSIEKVAMNKVLLKNISLVGIHWGAYTKNEPEMQAKVWRSLLELMNAGKFRGTVYKDESFVGLDRVKDALVALGSRGTWGKVVIDVLEDKSKL